MVAFVMMFGLALTTVHADGTSDSTETPAATTNPTTGTLTINNPNLDQQYSLYKLLSATYNASTQTSAYTISTPWLNALTSETNTEFKTAFNHLFTIVTTDGNIPQGVTEVNVQLKEKNGEADWTNETKAAAAKALAEAAKQYATTNSISADGTYMISTVEENGVKVTKAYTVTGSNKSEASENVATFTAAIAESQTPSKLSILNLPLGYYFVTTTTGSLVSMDALKPNAEVNDKNSIPPITKTVNNEYAGVGDTVTYTVTIPKVEGTPTRVVITDTMDEGLTFNQNIANLTVKAYTTAEGSTTETEVEDVIETGDYTFDPDSPSNGFTLTLTSTGLSKLTQYTLKISYSAQVNEKAVTKNQDNTVTLKYGNNDNADVETATINKTQQITILKHNAANIGLAGAEFNLKKGNTILSFIRETDGSYRKATAEELSTTPSSASTTLVSGTDGKIVIKGLGTGEDYTLTETKAPAGYNKLTADLSFTLTATASGDTTVSTVTLGDNHITNYTKPTATEGETVDSAQINVLNTTGAQLPSTGGSGTTMMYIAGGALLVGAVVLLITRKRVSE